MPHYSTIVRHLVAKKRQSVMTTNEDLWFTSLTIKEKECIASKILDSSVRYPEATGVWLNCSKELKAKIFDFCKNRSGDSIAEWDKVESFSY